MSIEEPQHQKIAEELAHTQQLIDTYTNNLRKAQLNAAEHGVNVPVYLQNEIVFYEKQLKILEDQFDRLTAKLKNVNTNTTQHSNNNHSINGLPLPSRLSNNKTQSLLQTLVVWSISVYIIYILMNLSMVFMVSIATPLDEGPESFLLILAFTVLLAVCIFIIFPRVLRFVRIMYIRLFKDACSPIVAMAAIFLCLYVGNLIVQNITFTLTSTLSAPFIGMYIYKIFKRNRA